MLAKIASYVEVPMTISYWPNYRCRGSSYYNRFLVYLASCLPREMHGQVYELVNIVAMEAAWMNESGAVGGRAK